ncbi:hypothetical protein OIDMADRAFT_52560 [Oidiodendron maius Zn]|uniref:Fumarylacetoacetase-like C-terminal domain-containing protein n=1 Tax=Oidiodendron maius (strain Zn) TaxID=913774 RepID=A0A0C3CUR9_OIDMZ|nr:hypothetical protein OIDMADRAFT_52560 [Oidiodendron maius Zn]
MAQPVFDRLVRFIPKSQGSTILLGQPVDGDIDVGAAIRGGQEVLVSVFSGKSVLNPGAKTDRIEAISRLASPLAQEEVGTIRCIGLNYIQHAKEVKMAIPDIPTLFLKPETALAGPWPEPSIIPQYTAEEKSADYESELVIVIGRVAKNVSEEEAMDYVLGYTAGNDISARKSQFAQTQWCFSKGFDGACPIGPVLASTKAIPDPSKLRLRGLKNGRVMQDCGLDDLIFSVPKIVSFCSQGTTLKPGTLILTGTPAGVGHSYDPKEYLHHGDEFAVELLPTIGTLITQFVDESSTR